MRRVALTFVAALAATAVMAPPASAQHHGQGGVYRSYQRPAHAGMHRMHRRPAVSYRYGYRSARVGWNRPWAGPRPAYRGYRGYAVRSAYRYRPYGVSVAGAAITGAALYGTGYGSSYYGSPYYGSVYSGGGLVAYPYPTYTVGYAGYAYGGCAWSCQPVVYYRSCGGCGGW